LRARFARIANTATAAGGVAQVVPPGPCCCAGDLDGNGIVDAKDVDLVTLLFGPCPDDLPCPADFDGNGVVDLADVQFVLANFGVCCFADLNDDRRVDETDVDLFETCWFGELCPPGPCCPLAFNNDGLIDAADVAIVKAHLGPCAGACPCPWDVDGNGSVGLEDLTQVLASTGECCPGDMNGDRIIATSASPT
jgi:hypothetical protein